MDLTLVAKPVGGAKVWSLGSIDSGGFSPSWREKATATVESVEVEEGKTTTVTVQAKLVDYREKDPTLQINGQLQAVGCGVKPAVKKPGAVLPLGFQYGGLEVPIRSALIESRGDDDLVFFSTHGQTCRDREDADLVLRLRDDGRWNQGNGNWTGNMNHASSYTYQDAEGRILKIGAAESGVAAVEVDWKGKIPASREPFTLEGTVQATDCR